MSYKLIIDRIITNVTRRKADRDIVPPLETIKADIYDSILAIHRTAEPIKKEFKQEINLDVMEYELPLNVYSVSEVLFFNIDNRRFYRKELQYEEFMRWQPNIDYTTGNFVEKILDGMPQIMFSTQENFDFDGYVGFTITDTYPQKILWKPAVNGNLVIYYSVYPELEDIYENIDDNNKYPDINKIFTDLIVYGATIRALIRELKKADNEIELYGLTNEINHYKTEYKELLSDYIGYVNKGASFPNVEPLELMNDFDAIIFYGR